MGILSRFVAVREHIDESTPTQSTLNGSSIDIVVVLLRAVIEKQLRVRFASFAFNLVQIKNG